MKTKWSLTIFILILIIVGPVAYAATPLKVFLNGQPFFGPISIVRIIDGLPFVSIDAISSELKLDVDYDEKNKTIHISNKGEPQSEEVATLKKAKATLYATKREGNLEKFRLEIDGQIRSYPYWRNSDFSSFGPRLFFEDINHDGKEELIIILTTGHGTGIMITEVHVLQKTKTNIGEIYEEKLIDNPEAIIYKNVKTKKLSDDKVEITIGAKKIVDSIDKSMAGETVEFSVFKNELVVYMRGHLSPLPQGGILITYQLKDKMYQPKKIEYLKKRPNFIMESSFQ